MDMGWAFAIKRYHSSNWKSQRRLFSQLLNPTTAHTFLHRQLTTTHTLLRSLLDAPAELDAHMKHAVANIILGIAYGYDVRPTNDPYVEIADRVTLHIGQGVSPGKYLVNALPWRES